MKLIGVLMVLAILGVCVYFVFEAASFDPNAKGEEVAKQVKRGMTWQEVIDIAGEPKKYRSVVMDEMGPGRGGTSPFSPEHLKKRMENGDLQHGFIFEYNYSDNFRLHLWFTPEGKVDMIDKQSLKIQDLTPY